MPHIDPYAGGQQSLYECLDCGRRVEDVSDGRLCRCGGYLQNIGQARGE
ncbi:rubrerythrin-like domain-containing protein [Salinirubellus salinus]|uniref:Rubrerythrin-like domain-containing protein n=1 Tax=Salinirubellus salinus TaxID=1364945 RepID=A0A9E7R659_9EURY|nr:rubrerythrin-like domain-containing protein [Salinirubellus salinus]UWM56171.1 rubrerythrin-like domain-containing protein [Salinirubellus salinus]